MSEELQQLQNELKGMRDVLQNLVRDHQEEEERIIVLQDLLKRERCIHTDCIAKEIRLDSGHRLGSRIHACQACCLLCQADFQAQANVAKMKKGTKTWFDILSLLQIWRAPKKNATSLSKILQMASNNEKRVQRTVLQLMDAQNALSLPRGVLSSNDALSRLPSPLPSPPEITSKRSTYSSRNKQIGSSLFFFERSCFAESN